MLDLKPPVPKPIIIKAMTKAPKALSFSITPGTELIIKMIWPTKTTARAQEMVLKRPQWASAT